MSDHTWVLENVASYLAEGLEPAERQRLEEHVASCPACAEALEQARSLDDTMQGLFADVRPGPALEDRMIQALRLAPRPRWRRLPLYRPLALGTAAAVLLGALGLFGSFIAEKIDRGALPFPGVSRSGQTLLAQNPTPVLGHERDEGRYDGLADHHATLPGYDAAWFDTDTLARQTREHAVAGLEELEAGQIGSAATFSADGQRRARVPITTWHLDGANAVTGEAGDRWGVANPPATQGVSPGDLDIPFRQNSFDRGEPTLGGFVADPEGTDLNGDGVVADSWARPTSPATADDGVTVDSVAAQDGTSTTFMSGLDTLGPAVGGGGRNQEAPGQAGGQRDPAGQNKSNFSDRYYSYFDKRPAGSTDAAAPESNSAEMGVAASPHFKPADLLADLEAVKVVPGQQLESLLVLEEQSLEQVVDAGFAHQEPGDSQAPGIDPETGFTAPPQGQPPAVAQRKVIRSGEMEFEVDSFDSAVEQITKITAEESGFIATVDSEQLPNGKVRGSVVVRVPPEHLDTLVLKLRALGELKSQRIGSQDVTKQYTDLESRLRAARAMEERLLEMIKNGQGDIEHLLEAEKELGVWRTKIEELEGELRYYNNVIALSTLRIGLAEQEIRAAAVLTEIEQVQMGIEVEDVEQAHQQALEAIAEADGLVTKSEVKQHAAEQYSALIHFEVTRDAAGPLRDRLRQIGNVARLEINRLQQAEDGTSRPADGRTVQKDTQFVVSLYNLANVAPRETVHVNLACTDTEATYKTILERVEQAGGRVVTSSLNSQNSNKTTGTVQFEVPAAEAEAVLTDVKAAGEVMRLEVTENPDSENVTKSKRGFNVQLWAMGLVAPRETIVLQVATEDVPAGYQALQEAVRKTTGRILNAQLNEQDKQNITAQLDFDIPRDAQPDLTAALAAVGEVFSRTVTRSQDDENVIDSKVRLQIALINQARIPPRETITLGIEVRDVDHTTAALTALVDQSNGRTVESHVAHERSGRVTAKLVFDVPLTAAGTLVDQFKESGTVRAQAAARNPQVPDGKLAIARLDVTLSNAELIVPRDEGLWSQIRTGLSTSFTAVSWSLIVVIVGLCFVLPWALVLYIIYRIIARFRRKPISGTPAA